MKNIAKMQLFVERHMSDGRALTVPCTIEVLSRKDQDISVKLHNEVAHGLSREIFAASTEDGERVAVAVSRPITALRLLENQLTIICIAVSQRSTFTAGPYCLKTGRKKDENKVKK